MICKNCGTDLAESDVCCFRCGKLVSGTPDREKPRKESEQILGMISMLTGLLWLFSLCLFYVLSDTGIGGVLGIITLISPIPAIVCGVASKIRKEHSSMATIGIILGVIGLLVCLFLVWLALIFVEVFVEGFAEVTAEIIGALRG